MAEWHQAKTEILMALYHYQLMSPRQFGILLGYEKTSIYRVGKHMLKQELIRSVVLPFLMGNSRAYALTRKRLISRERSLMRLRR